MLLCLGEIPHPLCEYGPTEVLYMMQLYKIEEGTDYYVGQIGWGRMEASMPVPVDMTMFRFSWNPTKREVRMLDVWPRLAGHVQELEAIPTAIVNEPDKEAYTYFRFPRTKDGISLSRAMCYIVKDYECKIYLATRNEPAWEPSND